MSIFGKTTHGENTARQLEAPEAGKRLSKTPIHLKGTKRDTATRWIPLDRIRTRKQIREEFDEAELDELAASLSEHGQQQACTVFWSDDDGGFVIVAGERRFRAATKATGVETLKCAVLSEEPSEQEHLELQLVENVQRSDLSAIEEAKAYQRFVDEFGFTQGQIAKRTGKNQSSVSRALKLMKLPEEIRDELISTKAPRSLAEKLYRLKTIEEQRDMLRRYNNDELTIRDAQEETSRRSGASTKKVAAKQVRVKKTRGIEYKATGKKKHTNTDYVLGTLDWCEDLATDKRATVDVETVQDRLREILTKLESCQALRAA